MALPMMMGSCLVSGVALYFTKQATRATTNATSSHSPLSGGPEETESLLCREAFDSGRSVEAAVVDGVVESNPSVGEGGGTTGRRAEVEPPGLWETAKNKFRWAKAKLKTLVPEKNAASSLPSGDREERESPESDILSLSPAAFESGRSVEAAKVENPTGTMVVEKASECNIPSPVALHAADGSEAIETDGTSVDVDPMAVGSTLAAECNMGSANVADVVHAAEGSKATEAANGTSAEVDLMAVGKTLAIERKSTRAVDVVHAAVVSEATEADGTSAEVDPMAVGSTPAAECNMLRIGAANAVHAAEGSKTTECNMLRTGAADVVNAASVDGDVEGDSSAGQGSNLHEFVAEAAKVGEEGGRTGSRAEVEPPELWGPAKRTLRWAKAKLKSGAEWMMLDPDVVRRILKSGGEWVMPDPAVVRRILKSMFLVVVDSVVNQAFKGNTVAFKLCAILISELKRCT